MHKVLLDDFSVISASLSLAKLKKKFKKKTARGRLWCTSHALSSHQGLSLIKEVHLWMDKTMLIKANIMC